MDYAALKSYVTGSRLLRRTDSGISALAGTAINEAKLQMQRGFTSLLPNGLLYGCTGDWCCMEAELAQAYVAGGINLATLQISAVTIVVKRVHTVWPSSDTTALPYAPLVHSEANEQVGSGALSRTTTMPTDTNARSWFVKNQKLVILPEPTSTTPLLELYRYLPDYSANADTDFFSQVLWDALGHWAASIVAKSLKHYDTAKEFRADAVEMIKQAWEADERNKAAGEADGIMGAWQGAG